MKRIRLVIALLAAVSMLGASVGPGALVLCFGSDGHVAVEPGDVLSRCAESRQQGSPEHGQEADCEACGPCNDIALDAQSATLAGLSKNLTPTPPSVLSEPVSSRPLTRPATLAPTLVVALPAAVSLRTTVLLV